MVSWLWMDFFRRWCDKRENGDVRRQERPDMLWELKMMQVGVILNLTDRSLTVNLTAPGAVTNIVHDLNIPYDGSEEYETPTTDLRFLPVPNVFNRMLKPHTMQFTNITETSS